MKCGEGEEYEFSAHLFIAENLFSFVIAINNKWEILKIFFAARVINWGCIHKSIHLLGFYRDL